MNIRFPIEFDYWLMLRYPTTWEWWCFITAPAFVWAPLLIVAYALGRRRFNLWLFAAIVVCESAALAWFVHLT